MNSIEFLKIRYYLKKGQSRTARLLGVSARDVQAFEQGWRRVPLSFERQMLYLLYLKIAPTIEKKPCWEVKKLRLKDETEVSSLGISFGTRLLVYQRYNLWQQSPGKLEQEDANLPGM